MPENSRTRPPALSRVALLTSLLILCSAVTMAQSPTAERIIENKIPAHVPLKVKIKNLPKVKDLTNKKWLRDLEVEVTNTGDKPIYHFAFLVDTLDVISPLGSPYAFTLAYGRLALHDLQKRALPEDIPLKPGESCILKIPEPELDGWEASKAEGKAFDPIKVRLIFVGLNFGDGTGFSTTEGHPYLRKATWDVFLVSAG